MWPVSNGSNGRVCTGSDKHTHKHVMHHICMTFFIGMSSVSVFFVICLFFLYLP